MEAEGME